MGWGRVSRRPGGALRTGAVPGLGAKAAGNEQATSTLTRSSGERKHDQAAERKGAPRPSPSPQGQAPAVEGEGGREHDLT